MVCLIVGSPHLPSLGLQNSGSGPSCVTKSSGTTTRFRGYTGRILEKWKRTWKLLFRVADCGSRKGSLYVGLKLLGVGLPRHIPHSNAPGGDSTDRGCSKGPCKEGTIGNTLP